MLDFDAGSARDINFEGMTWPDFLIVLQRALEFITDGAAYKGNGGEIPLDAQVVFDSVRTATNVQIHGVSNSAPFRRFQLFACVDNEAPFIELTFFPNDLADRDDPLSAVVGFINHLCLDTSVSNYFVRYENGGWNFGDTAFGSGVIFTRSDVATIDFQGENGQS